MPLAARRTRLCVERVGYSTALLTSQLLTSRDDISFLAFGRHSSLTVHNTSRESPMRGQSAARDLVRASVHRRASRWAGAVARRASVAAVALRPDLVSPIRPTLHHRIFSSPGLVPPSPPTPRQEANARPGRCGRSLTRDLEDHRSRLRQPGCRSLVGWSDIWLPPPQSPDAHGRCSEDDDFFSGCSFQSPAHPRYTHVWFFTTRCPPSHQSDQPLVRY